MRTYSARMRFLSFVSVALLSLSSGCVKSRKNSGAEQKTFADKPLARDDLVGRVIALVPDVVLSISQDSSEFLIGKGRNGPNAPLPVDVPGSFVKKLGGTISSLSLAGKKWHMAWVDKSVKIPTGGLFLPSDDLDFLLGYLDGLDDFERDVTAGKGCVRISSQAEIPHVSYHLDPSNVAKQGLTLSSKSSTFETWVPKLGFGKSKALGEALWKDACVRATGNVDACALRGGPDENRLVVDASSAPPIACFPQVRQTLKWSSSEYREDVDSKVWRVAPGLAANGGKGSILMYPTLVVRDLGAMKIPPGLPPLIATWHLLSSMTWKDPPKALALPDLYLSWEERVLMGDGREPYWFVSELKGAEEVPRLEDAAFPSDGDVPKPKFSRAPSLRGMCDLDAVAAKGGEASLEAAMDPVAIFAKRTLFSFTDAGIMEWTLRYFKTHNCGAFDEFRLRFLAIREYFTPILRPLWFDEDTINAFSLSRVDVLDVEAIRNLEPCQDRFQAMIALLHFGAPAPDTESTQAPAPIDSIAYWSTHRYERLTEFWKLLAREGCPAKAEVSPTAKYTPPWVRVGGK